MNVREIEFRKPTTLREWTATVSAWGQQPIVAWTIARERDQAIVHFRAQGVKAFSVDYHDVIVEQIGSCRPLPEGGVN